MDNLERGVTDKPTIIFDIDGTLTNVDHRRYHVTGGRKEWGAFFSKMASDPINHPIRYLLWCLYADNQIILCSGRPEDYREITEKYMRDHGIDYHALYMRASGDMRADHVVKKEMLDEIRAAGHDVIFSVDDRPTVVRMWRENGVPCLQVNDGWEEKVSTGKWGLLTLMVGPSGAGKSTFLQPPVIYAYAINASHIVSSDQIRQDLCGDFRDQSKNDEVFSTLHAIVKARVSNGLPTVVDATNIRRRDRLAIVGLTEGPVRYIVVDRPLKEKLSTAGWRADVKFPDGSDLITRHHNTFQSQIKDILVGDDLPNVEVVDLRT